MLLEYGNSNVCYVCVCMSAVFVSCVAHVYALKHFSSISVVFC